MTKQTSDCTNVEALLVVALNCLQRTDLERAGGKGANLGELIQAGFPVPPGFVITTAAYQQFVEHHHLRESIAHSLHQPSGSGGATSGGASGEAIREVFETAPIPAEIERQILAAYRQLGPGPVAVRSSATAEDLPDASFAGQQDTFLNVLDAEALLEAVRRCWASLWNERAISYRERQGIDQAAVRLAVVVQRMLVADVAGVMFTASPLSGARDETLIDASPGLGEAVVAGLVTPDHFVLRSGRWGWRIVERRAGLREVIVRARQGGGTLQVSGAATAQATASAACLSDRALRDLARFGAAIQRHFGSPQDVEWALENGRLFILQARPMTALPEPPPHANKLQRMLASNFAEMLPVRPYPLDLDTWLPALGSAVEPIFWLLGLDWQLRHMFQDEDGIVARYTFLLPRPTWRTLLAPLRLASAILRYNSLAWQSDPLLAESIARAVALEAQDLSALSWESLLARLQAASKIPFLAAGEIRRRYFPRAAFAALRLRLLLALSGQLSQMGRLLSGAENKTIEMNRALEALADRVRAERELAAIFTAYPPEALLAALAAQPAGRDFLAALTAFLDGYGHRETIISTAFEPTWKDAPAMVLGIIQGFASHPPQVQTGAPAWQAARDEVLRHPLIKRRPLRAGFLHLLAQARVLLPMREDTHFYAALSMPIFRRTLLEMGRRLAAGGVLDAAEDVFSLRLAELERVGGGLPLPDTLAAELREAAARRKSARARLEHIPPVDPRLFPQASRAGADGALLRGMAGSPGIAEGPARIIRDGSAFGKLVAGDVLVAPYTNPAWTPLFQRAAAVVVDTGSPASHAAIVAREYGIPAVMGTVAATDTLRDGDLIRVDGSQGTVYLLEAAAQGSPFES